MSAINPYLDSLLRKYVHGVPENPDSKARAILQGINRSNLWSLLTEVISVFEYLGYPLQIVGFRRFRHNPNSPEGDFNEHAYLCNARGFPIFEAEYIERVVKTNQSGFWLSTPYAPLRKRGENKYTLQSMKPKYITKIIREKALDIMTKANDTEAPLVPRILHSSVVDHFDGEEDKDGYSDYTLSPTTTEPMSILAVQYAIDIASGGLDPMSLSPELRGMVQDLHTMLNEKHTKRSRALKNIETFFAAPKWHIIVLYTSVERILGYMIGSYRARYDMDSEQVILDWLEGFRLYGRMEKFIETRGDDGQDLLVSLKTLQITRERLRNTGDDNLTTNAKSVTEAGKLVPLGTQILPDIGVMTRRIRPMDEGKWLHITYQHVVVDRGTVPHD